MEGLYYFVCFIIIVFGILQIILFFKIWGMTNDVKEIKKKLFEKELEKVGNIGNSKIIDGWAENATEIEKNEAIKLIQEVKPEQVIAKVISKKKMEIWSYKFWETEKNNPNYKLIYKS